MAAGRGLREREDRMKYWQCVLGTIAIFGIGALIIAIGVSLVNWLSSPWNWITMVAYLVVLVSTLIWVGERDAN